MENLSEDPVIKVYMEHVDRTLLRENLKLTPAQRLEKFVRYMRSLEELRRAGAEARKKNER